MKRPLPGVGMRMIKSAAAVLICLLVSMLVNRDQEVKVLEPGNEYKAHAIGINQTGELIVRTPDGKEKEIYAGEVSVRGVYGYV